MKHQKAISRAIERIETAILQSEAISVEQLSREAFFSRYHFQRVFRKITGISVMEYVRKRKLTLAASEISQGAGNILEIAFKYGYQSNEAFTRAFKAFHTVRPSETRRYGISQKYPVFNAGREENMKKAIKLNEELKTYALKLRETADFAALTAKNAGVPPQHVAALTKRTEFLASQIERLAEQLSTLTDLDAHDIVKQFDEYICELNLTAFNLKLTLARQGKEYFGVAAEITDAYNSLIAGAVKSANECNNLLNTEFDERARQFAEAAVEAANLSRYIRGKSSDPVFAVIADELSAAATRLSEQTDAGETAFALRILALHAELDALRQIDNPFENLAKQIEILADKCAEIEDMNLPKNATEKAKSELDFNSKMLNFYLRSEIAKSSKLNIDASGVLEALNSGNNSAIAATVRNHALKLGEKGGTFEVIAEEYEKFCD
jgi:AraC-like DNA-binding protein